MHYHRKAEAKDPRYNTLITRDPFYQDIIGLLPGMSRGDVAALNRAYCTTAGKRHQEISLCGGVQ